jgi:prepilin signal peptidase PulO-like enzyme (type II secretory pathway)
MSIEALTGICFFILGSILASFAGVIAERLGTGQSFMKGRSKCNACNRHLTSIDLVPILSYLFQRGRCRVCSARITYRYALSELLLGSVFLLLYFTYGLTFILIPVLVFTFLLSIVIVYDLRHTIVPFGLSLVLVALGVFLSYLGASSKSELSIVFLTAGGIGLFFYLLHVLSRGRWMGLGDTPIALSLSLVVGAQAISGLLFSFWAGAVVGIVILALTPPSRRMGIEVPFVPFLAFGYFLALITQWNPLHFI